MTGPRRTHGLQHDYIGRFTVTPPRSEAEVEWLEAFSAWSGGPHGTPFQVPMNPRGEWAHATIEAGESIATGRAPEVPWGAFDWQPCPQGCCLAWRPSERSSDGLEALTFLVDYFLGPKALGRAPAGSALDDFTFDHVLYGAVAAVRDDTDELFLIRAVRSNLRHETVVPGRGAIGDVAADDDD